MTGLYIGTKRGLGFASVASFAGSALLTGAAFGAGSDFPDGTVAITEAEILAGFTDTGDTTAAGDEFDEDCGFGLSAAPDLFYAITPDNDIAVDVALCGSEYDTKLFMFDEVTFIPFVCNVDACDTGPLTGSQPFASALVGVELDAGVQYFVAIDGQGGIKGLDNFGPYTITVVEGIPPEPCTLTPPEGGTPEGEPLCGDDYVDDFNGGCNSEPPVFSTISLGETIAGEAGTYDQMGTALRDTDWYQIELAEDTMLGWGGSACFPFQLIVIDGNAGCPLPDGAILEGLFVDAFATDAIELELLAGTYYLFAAIQQGAGGTPCGSEYTVTAEVVLPPCPADLNFNGEVEFGDLLELLVQWGPCPGTV